MIDTFGRKWRRRAVTVPACITLALASCLGAPLWVVVALAVDMVTGRARRLPRTRALAFFTFYLCCEAAGIVFAAVLWLITSRDHMVGPGRYRDANAALQRWWTDARSSTSTRIEKIVFAPSYSASVHHR